MRLITGRRCIPVEMRLDHKVSTHHKKFKSGGVRALYKIENNFVKARSDSTG